MNFKPLTASLSVTEQIRHDDIAEIARQGFKLIINNRPDGESQDQPNSAEIAAEAERQGLGYRYIPVVSGNLTDHNVYEFADAIADAEGPVLAYCRTGTRSTMLWALSACHTRPPDDILETADNAGFNLEALRPRLVESASAGKSASDGKNAFDVVIVGGGSAGLSTAASLLRRRGDLKVAVIEPNEKHYYQPGFTLVGGGAFRQSDVVTTTARVMPKKAHWIRQAAAGFEPDRNLVVLEDGSSVSYDFLVVAPGLKLDWDAIPGLSESLGSNGVTSNYRYDLTPYTWELVSGLKSGRAVFTQPPMPIKCAGAPQKAMYLSCDHWLKSGVLDDIDVEFCNAGGVLFGVDAYVPALMKYVEKYDANLNFMHTLVEIDGASKTAWFDVADGDSKSRKAIEFDMIHVCPPQTAPDFIRDSALSDAAGWVDVCPDSLRHRHYDNIYGLGDATNTSNAKTMAAVRKQAPVVASNIVAALDGRGPEFAYDGYGSCPLTVERGKVVLAEFGYGGKLTPTFPSWLNNGLAPTRLAWLLKAKLLPPIYYQLVLKGREWLVSPEPIVQSMPR